MSTVTPMPMESRQGIALLRRQCHLLLGLTTLRECPSCYRYPEGRCRSRQSAVTTSGSSVTSPSCRMNGKSKWKPSLRVEGLLLEPKTTVRFQELTFTSPATQHHPPGTSPSGADGGFFWRTNGRCRYNAGMNGERDEASENPYEAPTTPQQRQRHPSPYWPIDRKAVMWIMLLLVIAGLVAIIILAMELFIYPIPLNTNQ